jgi:predicted transcriptional regulator
MAQVDSLADAQRLSRSQLLENWIREQIEQQTLNVQMMANPVVMQAMMAAFAKPEVFKAMVSAVGDELSAPQLELFHRGLSAAHEEAQKVHQIKAKPAKARRRKK